MTWPAILVLTAFAVGGLFAILSFVMFDRLVRIEHTNHHEAWVSDGSPIGFFWIPPDGKTFFGSLARSRCSFKWMFSTPPWIENEPAAAEVLRRMRKYTWYSTAGLVFFGASILILQMIW